MCLELSSYSIFVQVQVFWTRCLEPSSPSVGRKFSFPSSAATASPLIRQEFGKRQEGAQRQKGEVSVEGTEEGNGCWMPDPAQFVQKRIKVEGVGIKMVQDLTMDDFLRWVRLCLTFYKLLLKNCEGCPVLPLIVMIWSSRLSKCRICHKGSIGMLFVGV